MTTEQGVEQLNLGLLCFIGARAVETRVLEALAAAGFDDITSSQGRIVARIGPHGTRIGELAEQALVTKQTATATEEISGQIARVQGSTGQAVTAIGVITARIQEISGVSTTIAAAVDEAAENTTTATPSRTS